MKNTFTPIRCGVVKSTYLTQACQDNYLQYFIIVYFALLSAIASLFFFVLLV